MSDEIYYLSLMHRKTAKETCRSKCAAPRRVMNNHKATCYCPYLGHQNEVTLIGGISERRPKSEPFVFIRLFRIRGSISTWLGRKEGGANKRGGASSRKFVLKCGYE